MAKIVLHHVNIEFPIYTLNARSFKRNFIRLTTGGAVAQSESQKIVVKALNDIHLTIEDGDRVGLIGHNGAGKSTLLRVLSGIYEPTSGCIHSEGKVNTLFNLMLGIESDYTGYENIMLRGLVLGVTSKKMAIKAKEIADFTGLGDYLHIPVRTYSSGMRLRLAFAISLSIDPEILLIDEVFAAGDEAFMSQAHAKMVSLLNESSIVVMANHADAVIRKFCNKAILLENGYVKYFGPTEEAYAHYYHTHKIEEVTV